MNLNPGGIIGALLPLGIGLIFVFLVSSNEAAMKYAVQSMFAFLIVGALIGNFLWGKFVSKPDEPPTDPNQPH